ncbi:hypothetical protein [Rathayibacter soli]|uniref:hypothetical protein n=1 Tax=Rathayibacter soli TaxID=3144168 RepID=UPI0027E43383|nr:hypothetical protein [Glaciibacter superstes]
MLHGVVSIRVLAALVRYSTSNLGGRVASASERIETWYAYSLRSFGTRPATSVVE